MFDSRVLYAMKDRHVNCIENPHNIDPAVEGILKAIEKGKVKAKQKGQPLVVLMGENHSSPICYMMHIAVMSRLVQAGENIRIGHELDSAALLKRIRKTRRIPPTKSFAKAINKALSHPDLWGDTVRSCMDEKNYGRFTMAVFLDTLEALGQSLDSNDHPFFKKNGDIFLDETNFHYDKNWLSAGLAWRRQVFLNNLADHFPIFSAGVPAVSKNGMSVRNQHMTNEIVAHCREDAPEIYIQFTGRSHVIGDDIYPYEDSMEAFLRQKDCHVVSILPEILKDKLGVEQKSLKAKDVPYFIENGLFINGLSGEQFICRDDSDPAPIIYEEAEELRRIIDNSSLGDVISKDDIDTSLDALKQRMALPPIKKEPKGKGTYFDRVQRTARNIIKQTPQ